MFKTNSVERLRLKSNGETKLSGIAGTGNRLLYLDQNGIVQGRQIIISPPLTCNDPNIFAFQQNPNNPTAVYTCWNAVGIGTDNPQAALHIKGDARFSWHQNLSNYSTIGHDGSNGFVFNRGIGDLLINYVDPLDPNPIPKNVSICGGASGDVSLGGNNYFAPDALDKVGIGINTPISKLHVFENSNDAKIIISNSTDKKSGFWAVNDEFAFGFGIEKINQQNTGYIYSEINNSNKIMSFTSNGHVGIGNNSPSEALQIGDRLTIHSGGNKAIGYNFYWDNFTGENKKLVADESSAIYLNNDGSISFESEGNNSNTTGTAFSWQKNLHINNNGRVGIGMITEPDAQDDHANALLGINGNLIAREIWLSQNNLNADPIAAGLYSSNGTLTAITADLFSSNTKIENFSVESGGYVSIPGIPLNSPAAHRSRLYINNPNDNLGTPGIIINSPEQNNLVLYTNNEENKVISSYMGSEGSTITENFCVYGNGGVRARNIKVTNLTFFPDYVFSNDYNLMPLADLERYIKDNKHLPEVPSAYEVKTEGLDIEKMLVLQMKKIEELTLYILELEKSLKKLSNEKNR